MVQFASGAPKDLRRVEGIGDLSRLSGVQIALRHLSKCCCACGRMQGWKIMIVSRLGPCCVPLTRNRAQSMTTPGIKEAIKRRLGSAMLLSPDAWVLRTASSATLRRVLALPG
jgi:hypothetical protein